MTIAAGIPVGLRPKGWLQLYSGLWYFPEMTADFKDLFPRILDAVQTPLFVLDDRGRLVLANDAFRRAHGLSGQAILGRPFHEIPGLEDVSRLMQPRLDRCLVGEALSFQEWFPFLNLGSRLLDIHFAPWRDPVDDRPHVVATCRDVTDQTMAAEALRASEGEFHRILETMQDAYIRVSLEGEIEMVNPAAARLLGWSVRQLSCLDPRGGLCAEPEVWDAALDKLRDGASLRDVEMLFRRADHQVICRACDLRLVNGPNRQPRAVELTVRDITPPKRSDNELDEYRAQLERRVIERTSQLTLANKMLHDKVYELVTTKRELSEYRIRLRELATEISLVEERERRRLALELHDGIVQDLAMARIRLSSLAEKIESPLLARELAGLLELTKKMIRESRSLVWEMGSPELYELGLEAALEELVEEFDRRYDIRALYRRNHEDPLPLAEDMQIMLFQMVRELLANVVKHARARTVHVECSRNQDNLCLHVEDDGVGFDPDIQLSKPGKDSGFGLFSIRERLSHIGGCLELRISHLGGAHCCIILPLTTTQEIPAP